MEQKTSRKIYLVNPVDYILVEEVGQGVSAVVYRGTCIPFNETVAVKVLDLERCNSSLDEIRREAQTMRLTNHPNILSAHCSFVVEQSLWVVMPYMAGGSFFHIMKSAYPDGFEEPVIATILRECLKGLEYLHSNGFIHRDVKAGNILVDRSGAVKLGDFGVSACMFDTGDRHRSWNTFAGTPCWMAPEVMEQFHGYDFKADIWSFGITALELAHGHAPFSKYPPMKVLLMTLQNAPPGLDYERDKRFSKAFKKLIAVCLVKDPSKRPSAEKLLKHSFFKRAHSHEYIARTILDNLPPLGQRLRDMKLKDADMLAQNKMPFDEEERSQNEYKRGISAWNFDVEDLKAQAALIQDDDESIVKEDATCTSRKSENLVGCPNDEILQSPATIGSLRQESLINADGHITGDQSRPLLASSLQKSKEVLENMHKEDGSDNRVNEVRKNVKKETNKHDPLLQKLEEKDWKVKRLPRDSRRSSSGPLLAEHVLSSYHGRDEDKDPERKSFQCNGDVFQSCLRGRREHTFSGPLTLKGTIEGLERGGLCVRRGRFSVTPEDVDLLEVEASDREQQLLQKMAKLQQRIDSLEAELEATKLRNRHLEQQLNIQQTTRGNNNRGR